MQKKIPAEEYRKPMYIKHYYVDSQNYMYPLCPRCKAATCFDYQKYCTGCGQHLRWNFSKMKNRYPKRSKR